MTDIDDDTGEFAVSLMSLTLIRNGYITQKNARFGKGVVIDIFAQKPSDDEAFAVEVKWVSNSQTEMDCKRLKDMTSHLEETIGIPVYSAVVIGDGSRIMADKALIDKMLYEKTEVEVSCL